MTAAPTTTAPLAVRRPHPAVYLWLVGAAVTSGCIAAVNLSVALRPVMRSSDPRARAYDGLDQFVAGIIFVPYALLFLLAVAALVWRRRALIWSTVVLGVPLVMIGAAMTVSGWGQLLFPLR